MKQFAIWRVQFFVTIAEIDKDKMIEEQAAMIGLLQKKYDCSETENKQLKEHVKLLLRKLYGRSSERSNSDPNQGSLFENLEVEVPEVQGPPAPPAQRTARRRSAHGRKPFADHLERVDIPAFDVPEKDRTCSCCGKPMVFIGEDKSERGHFLPSRLIVNCYTTKKYGCPSGHQVKSGTGPASCSATEGSKYEASVHAHAVVAKFADHLPIDRVAGMFKRRGFEIAKSTLNDMVIRVAETVAQPIVLQAKKELLAEEYLQADESPIQVFVETEDGDKSKRSAERGWMWVFRAGIKFLMEFRRSRKKECPSEFLRGWKGKFLQTDGYSGYDQVVEVEDLIRVGCMMHCRRGFFDAAKAGYREADRAIRLINRLYWIESAIKQRFKTKSMNFDESLELTRRVRQRRSAKVMEKFERLIVELDTDRAILPKGAFGGAVTYAMNQMKTLKVFLKHPNVEIDNGGIERSIRPLALGKKNWLFAGSERGARAAACLYSLLASAKVLGIDPEAYLLDLIVRFDVTPPQEYHTLTPWAWAAARAARVTAANAASPAPTNIAPS